LEILLTGGDAENFKKELVYLQSQPAYVIEDLMNIYQAD